MAGILIVFAIITLESRILPVELIFTPKSGFIG